MNLIILFSSLFGIRSKRQQSQQTTTNGTMYEKQISALLNSFYYYLIYRANDTKSPTTTTPSRPAFGYFSTRLRPTSTNSNLPFSGRNISARQNTNLNPHISQEKKSSTSNSIHSKAQPQITNLILNPGIKKQILLDK